MKAIKLTVLSLFLPIIFFAQSLTGLWTGTLTNDSNTIRRDQSFEIVLTQYKDKVYGYSRMTFFVHDTLYYIVKRVKGTVEGDVCEVKDDDIISHNFPRKPDKGVKLISIFRRNQQDSSWRLEGDWKTTENKRFYSISGKISLKTEPDITKSKLMPHLEELKLADDVAFYKESKKPSEPIAVIKQTVKETKSEPVIKTDKPIAPATKETKKTDIAQTKQPTQSIKKETLVTEEKPLIASSANNNKDNPIIIPAKSDPAVQTKQPDNTFKKEQPIIEQKTIAVAPKNNKKDSIAIVQVKTNPATVTSQPVSVNKNDVIVKEKAPEKQEPKKSEPVVLTKPIEQKKEPVVEQSKPQTKNSEVVSTTVTTKENDKPQPVSIFSDIKPAVTPTAAVFVAERKVAPPQIVNFISDSLELALYDNGEVDGDTVSVLVNGEIILAKQGLKTSAIKKMIYPGNSDSLIMVLYAENLGKYPPNTGLLIVHDGEETYQIRFSADLQQNAAVIFKRKRN